MSLCPVELLLEVHSDDDISASVDTLAIALAPYFEGGTLEWHDNDPLVKLLASVEASSPTDAVAVAADTVARAVGKLADLVSQGRGPAVPAVSVAAVRSMPEPVDLTDTKTGVPALH